MTEELKLVEVTQADHEAAYAFTRTGYIKGSGGITLLALFFARHRVASTPAIDREQVAREALKAADAWDVYHIAIERANAAIPAIDATRAEREVYDERYRTMEESKREMYRVAFDFAKWASENSALIALLSGEG